MGNELNKTQNFILWWNATFPYDFMWRKKYNIPFMSDRHRNVSLYDIFIDIYEDSFLRQLVEEEKKKAEERDVYELTGEYIKRNSRFVEMSSKEIDNFIENIDIDTLNKLESDEMITLR